MRWRHLVGFVILLPHIAYGWWDVRSVKKQPGYKKAYLYKRAVGDVGYDIKTDWANWPNATKDYNYTTCAQELGPYPTMPKIVTDIGSVYDVKQLKTFKNIGDSFLKMVKRYSLKDTVKLTMDLWPLDTINKIMQIMEYQLTMVILIAIGLFTATLILVVYVIFWSMKLTGNITEVNCQRIADSQGPMRLILSFLLLIFTIFVIIGCTIAFVSNTHISNNVNEAANQIQWTVNVSSNFTSDIEAQMTTLFNGQYRDTMLVKLRTLVGEAVINASALVYLQLQQNISDTYNKSLKLAYNIQNIQYAQINLMNETFKKHNFTLYNYTAQIRAAQACVEALDKICAANSGKCDDKKTITKSYLNTVDPAKFYSDEIANATTDINNIVMNGKMTDNALVGYLNGKFFHNGTLETPGTTFFSDSPTYTETCTTTDRTTGVLRTKTSVNTTTVSQTIVCNDYSGCRVTNTSTVLLAGVCCVELEYVATATPYYNNTAQCGQIAYYKNGEVQLTQGNQSEYVGNYSVTLSNASCVPWSEVMYEDTSTSWAATAYSQAYYWLFLKGDSDYDQPHSKCRNPMGAAGIMAADVTEIRTRAWCFTNKTTKAWEYCDVPYCQNDTINAMAVAKANGASAFFYRTCDDFKAELYKDAKSSKDNFTLWQTSNYPRAEAYFALDESATEMNSQFDVIQELFTKTNQEFTELQASILSSISNGSEASKFDGYRNIGTIVVVNLCMLSACLAVVGVCMGYCNINSDAAPHMRTSACNAGGKLIKISSYWAGMMAILNLYIATVYFLPGAVFSLVCQDYADDKIFELFDEEILVNYSILGRAVLGNDSYKEMTLLKLWTDCSANKTLWVALGLNEDPDYQLSTMMQLNESLDIDYTFTQLRKSKYNDFTDYPMYPAQLKLYLELWNASTGTTLPWTTIKKNLNDYSFMGATKSVLESNKFCKLFADFSGQIGEGDVQGTDLACKKSFDDDLEDQCDEWLKEYDSINTELAKLKGAANTIEGSWKDYGSDFTRLLVDQYNFTNNNLLNIDNTFSYTIILAAYDYWKPVLENEVSCFSHHLNTQMQDDFTICYPVSKVINNTMGYFCDYMVTSMTLAWMSQGLLGLILTFHMLVASKLCMFFLKMEVRHIDDISKEEIIAAFQ